MMKISLRIGITLSGIAFIFFVCSAREAEASPRTPQSLIVERDTEKEDQVAKLFEDIRSEANISKLQRIRRRASLEQSVCTSAFTDDPPKFGAVFYETLDPGTVTPQLKKIALSNHQSSNKKPRYSRYSIAVWRAQDRQTGNISYRVGVGLYGNALGEFVDCHFTDDVHYCGNWKKSIAPECRRK